MLTFAYGLLAIAILWILLRLWESPAQVIALILAMHGIDQMLIAGFPFIAAQPHLVNVAIAALTVSSLAIAAIRRPTVATPRGWVWLASLLVVFLLLYAIGVSVSGHGEEAGFTSLIRGVIPYALLQLELLPLIVARSSTEELREAFGMTGVLCMCVMLIVALDTSLRTEGMGDGNRVALHRLGEEGPQLSNTLALADVGVLALVMTLLVGLRSEWLTRVAPGISSTSVVGWVVGIIAVLYLVWVMRISRTEPFAGVLALVTTWLLRPHRNRLRPFVVAGLVVTTLCFLGPQLFEALLEAVPQLQRLDEGFRDRKEFIQHSLEAYFNGDIVTLLFGLGPGYSYVNIGTYPHHHLIETITELGLCGLAVYTTILWYAAQGVRRIVGQARPAFRGVVEVTSTMFVYSLVLSLKRGSVLAPDIFMWSFFVVEFLGRVPRAEKALMPRLAPGSDPLRMTFPLPRPA